MKESDLDTIIETNDLSAAPMPTELGHIDAKNNSWHALPICARKMLQDGVSQFQRSSCFRLAIHLKRLGLPFDMAVAALKTWALKNKPVNGKGIIQDSEIISQASYAYNHRYAGYACDDSAIKPFCEPSCPVNQWRASRLAHSPIESLPKGRTHRHERLASGMPKAGD